MRRLIRAVAGRRANGERGAVLVLTAFLVMFVAIGMLALTIDLGNITYNRAELQNGADASALALAANCANATATSPTCQLTDELRSLAAQNASANDQSMNILPYDGDPDAAEDAAKTCIANYSGATTLPSCTTDPKSFDATALSSCQPWPLSESAATLPYVEVTTQTEMKDGTRILPFHFAQILSGEGSGSTSETCSRAAWGTVVKAPIKAPMTISACQWKEETSDGADYVPTGPTYSLGGPSATDPGYGGVGEPAWPSADREIVVMFHDPSDTSNCQWNGKQTAGGFGYIGDKKTCSATLTDDDWAPIDTGGDPPKCDLTGQVLEIPIFDCIVASDDAPTGLPPTEPPGVCDPTIKHGGGAKTWYHIAGFGKFYVSGVKLSGSDSGSVMPGGHTKCDDGPGGSGRCLMGWFLKGTIDDASEIAPPGGGNDFGLHAVLPAG